MVRVISEKLFSPPRSRHSSGETLDKELAARAFEAFSVSFDSRRFEFSDDYESSSDSHWDSEVDLDGDSQDSLKFGQCAGEGAVSVSDVARKRRERRRERNKLSAQAYRQRRREQSVKQQKVLTQLEEENRKLKSTVQNLEGKVEQIKTAMRQRHSSNGNGLATFNGQATAGGLPTFAASSATCDQANGSLGSLQQSTATTNANQVHFVQNRQPVVQCESFGSHQLFVTNPSQAVDNMLLHHQQNSGTVDNFLFATQPASSRCVNSSSFVISSKGSEGSSVIHNPTITNTTCSTSAVGQVVHFLHSDQNANSACIPNNLPNNNMYGNDNMNNNASNLFSLTTPSLELNHMASQHRKFIQDKAT